jgi:hypothetical protein
MADDKQNRAFIYKTRFQGSLHIKQAEARYKNAGRVAEKLKQAKLEAKKKEQQKSSDGKSKKDHVDYQSMFGDTIKEMTMTPDMISLAGVKHGNNRLAQDMKKNKQTIEKIDFELIKLNEILIKARSDYHKEIQEQQKNGLPRKIDKMKRQIEQLRSKVSLENLSNIRTREKIDEKRLELTNLTRVYKECEATYSMKLSHSQEMREDIQNDMYDIEDSEAAARQMTAEIRLINKEFKEKYEEKLLAFEEQHAKDMAVEKKIEDLLLDSPVRSPQGKGRGGGGGRLPGNSMQGMSNIFFSAEDDEKRRKKLIHGNISKLGAIQSRVTSYEGAFEAMRSETGIADANELVEVIIESDRKNFGVYNQLNDLNREIEELEVSNKSIRRSIREINMQKRAQASGRVVHVDRVKDRLTNTTQNLASSLTQYEQKKKSMALLGPLLKNLFSILGCNVLTTGDITNINERNVMPLLGSVEQRILDLANIVFKLEGNRSSGTAFGLQGRAIDSDRNSFFMTQHGSSERSPLRMRFRPRELPDVETFHETLQETPGIRPHAKSAISPISTIEQLKHEAKAVVERQEAQARIVSEALERAAKEMDEEELPSSRERKSSRLSPRGKKSNRKSKSGNRLSQSRDHRRSGNRGVEFDSSPRR